jgi:peptidoglycan/xylan/chitin deacetylase (PgdA/CDA1 family)
MESKGIFVISLDFELYWGIREKRSLDSVRAYLENTHVIFPRMLRLFREYEVKATFATVGLLVADSKAEMMAFLPEIKPDYDDPNLSSYHDGMAQVGPGPEADPYHFGGASWNLLKEYPEHELGTHTFSHYFCLEDGESLEAFRADLRAAKSIGEKNGLPIDSLVFPRNQYTPNHIRVCAEEGVKTYRGNEQVWFRKPRSERKIGLLIRIVRTLDIYLNLSGNHCYKLEDLSGTTPVNIPSSRFFRPYMARGGRVFEALKLRRIKQGMTEAAKKGLLFHLWWHPHNFGAHMEENLRTFEAVLKHYKELQERYGFQNRTMGEVGQILSPGQNLEATPKEHRVA